MCITKDTNTAAIEAMKEHMFYGWESNVMGSGYGFRLRSPWGETLYKMSYYDEFDITAYIDDEEPTKEQEEEYYKQWKEEDFYNCCLEMFIRDCTPKFIHFFEDSEN